MNIFCIALFSIEISGTLFALAIMLNTQGCRNYLLALLLLCILGYSSNALAFQIIFIKTAKPSAIFVAIYSAFEVLTHWLISYQYLQVSNETKYLLDIEVLLNDPVKIAEVGRFKKRMRQTHIPVVLLIVALSVLVYFGWVEIKEGDTSVNYCYIIGSYGLLAIIIILTFLWGRSLIKLYKDTQASEKLLPKQWIFKLHGTLLVLYLVFQSLDIFCQ